MVGRSERSGSDHLLEPVVPMQDTCPHEGSTTDAEPPRVPGLPVLGNTHQLLKNPGHFFPDAYARHGPIFRVKVAGTRYTVLAGREAFDFFMETREKHFSRAAFYDRFGREIGTERFILGEPPSSRKDLRRKMRLGLSRQTASAYLPQMVDAVDRTLEETPSTGSVRVMDLTAAISFEQYGYLLSGRSVREAFRDAYLYTRFIMNVGTKLWPPITLQFPPYKRARGRVFRFAHQMLDEARRRDRSDPGSSTLLDALLSARDDDGSPVPDHEIVSCALYGFVGTLVYNNRAASFLLHHVLADAELRERATEEADAAFAGGTPGIRDLRRMTSLRRAYRETMRYHPIALGLPFLAEEDFVFEGHRVRRGEYVVVSAVPGHFSDRFYTCPYHFDPDRFLPHREEHRHRGAYAPFGLATRFCPAAGLVELMTLCTVGRMLNRREMGLRSPRPIKERLNPLPGPSHRYRIRMLGDREPRHLVGRAPDADAEAMDSALPHRSAELDAHLGRAVVREYTPGDRIIREGDPAETFYVISQGTVEVIRGDQPVAHLGPGEYFGEIGLLGEGVRTATCRAAGDRTVRVLAIAREDFIAMVEASDLVSDELAAIARRRYLAAQLREAIPRAGTSDIEQFLEAARVERGEPGQTIVRQGEPAEDFYIILRGRVEVLREDRNGAATPVATLHAGEFFGEIGLLHGKPRTATVKVAADEAAELLVIGREAFSELMDRSPSAREDIAAVMCERVLETLSG